MSFGNTPEMAGVKKMAISNEKEMSIDDILAEANAVYAEYRKAKLHRPGHGAAHEQTEDEKKAIDAHLTNVQRTHKDLYSAYPTVLRHMIEGGEYNPSVFKKYLELLLKRPWKNDSERFDSYTTYFTMLWTHYNPKYKTDVLRALKRDYRARLQSEHDKFKDYITKYQRDVELEEEKHRDERNASALKILGDLSTRFNLDADVYNGIRGALYSGVIKSADIEKICQQILQMTPEELEEINKQAIVNKAKAKAKTDESITLGADATATPILPSAPFDISSDVSVASVASAAAATNDAATAPATYIVRYSDDPVNLTEQQLAELAETERQIAEREERKNVQQSSVIIGDEGLAENILVEKINFDDDEPTTSV